jgi:hypothetical protein
MAAADYKKADLTAQNTFSDWISPVKTREPKAGYLSVSVTGTWAGTITVQKRMDHAGTYTDPIDVEDYTENMAKLIEDHVWPVEYRVGFKTGNYTSGTAAVIIER